MASIFVQVAAYHDFELGKTLVDVLTKSSGDHDIHFGVHLCSYQENEIFIPPLPNLKSVESAAPDNIGVGIARSLANLFYDGQDYYLQIDSHSRMYRNWDAGLINLAERYIDEGVDKPLFTTYPSSYTYDDNLREDVSYSPDVTAISFIKNAGAFTESLIPHQLAIAPDEGDKQRGVAAGFIFTVGDYAHIGFNEKIMFWGEEILIAASAYTNGFDLFVPDKQYVSHLYFDHQAVFQKNMRRHIWKDFPEEYQAKDAESKAEVIDIFTNKRTGYGALGIDRTLAEYGKYAGLDFDRRKIIIEEEISE